MLNKTDILHMSLKHLLGTSDALLETYLFQYMFRTAHKNEKIWQNFWYWVAHKTVDNGFEGGPDDF